MLKIVIPGWEDYDPVQERFIQRREKTISLEHSLVSISKWESKYHKSFMNNPGFTADEMLDYIKFMAVNEDLDDVYLAHLNEENVASIEKYIEDPMTATTFNRRGQKSNKREIVTSELVYYWMTALQIPFECQYWHLNRLMTLIEIAMVKNQKPQKMSKKDAAAQYHALNKARRAKHHSKG